MLPMLALLLVVRRVRAAARSSVLRGRIRMTLAVVLSVRGPICLILLRRRRPVWLLGRVWGMLASGRNRRSSVRVRRVVGGRRPAAVRLLLLLMVRVLRGGISAVRRIGRLGRWVTPSAAAAVIILV